MSAQVGTPPAKLADILSKASGLPVTAAMITADIRSGAPVNPDGSMNLVRYVAWLLKHGRADQN